MTEANRAEQEAAYLAALGEFEEVCAGVLAQDGPLDLDKQFKDYEDTETLDDLDVVEVLLAAEEHFGVETDPEVVERVIQSLTLEQARQNSTSELTLLVIFDAIAISSSNQAAKQ